MKKIYKFLICGLLTILICLILTSLYYVRTIDITLSKNNAGSLIKKRNPKYHFAVILQESDDLFWKGIKNGVIKASDNLNIASEINEVDISEDYSSLIRFMDIAIESKVDGIITGSSEKQEFIHLINKAEEVGIPVITVGMDITESMREAFVGTNGFEVGNKAGQLAYDASNGNAKIAMIFNNYSNNSIYSNLIIGGFRDAINSFSNMEIIAIESSSSDIISAEDIAERILKEYPKVDMIFCASYKDTIGVAQVIVDYNMVGDIKIIGYENSPEIVRYVDKGVVYGTVVADSNKIGEKSVEALLEIKENGRTSETINTDVNILVKENVKTYKDMIKKNNEQGANK